MMDWLDGCYDDDYDDKLPVKGHDNYNDNNKDDAERRNEREKREKRWKNNDNPTAELAARTGGWQWEPRYGT
jgi:hypothetical protein